MAEKMTVTQFLADLQLPPLTPYVGKLKNSDYLFALALDGDEAGPGDYAVSLRAVENYGHTIEATTQAYDFMNDGHGDATGHAEEVQAIFPQYQYAGRRYVGDYVQDNCFAHRYEVRTIPYVRVNLRTGEYETGFVSVRVTEPGGNGNALEWTNIAITMIGTGKPVDGLLPFPAVIVPELPDPPVTPGG